MYVSVGDIARVGIHPPNVVAVYRNSDQLFALPLGYDLVTTLQIIVIIARLQLCKQFNRSSLWHAIHMAFFCFYHVSLELKTVVQTC